MDKNRFLAFSDAIIAIIITILVLELPKPKGFTFNALFANWRSLIIYTVTFILLLATWYNHHNLFLHVKHLDHRIFWSNGLWLLVMSFIPYAANWLSLYPTKPAPGILYFILSALWTFSFQVLSHEVGRINPSAQQFERLRFPLLYIGYFIDMITYLFVPSLGIFLFFVLSVGATYLTHSVKS